MSQQLNILYVEDDIGSRRVMEVICNMIITDAKLTMFEESNNFMDRVAALDPSPNLILLDIHVEPIGGFEMLELLRQSGKYSDVPIVALTASVMNEEIQKLKSAGFSSVIAKPVNVDTFPLQLERIMSGENVWNILS